MLSVEMSSLRWFFFFFFRINYWGLQSIRGEISHLRQGGMLLPEIRDTGRRVAFENKVMSTCFWGAGMRQQKFVSHISGGQKSPVRVWQGRACCEACGEAPSWRLVMAGNPWCSWACGYIAPVSAVSSHGPLSSCVPALVFSPLLRTPVILGLGPTPLHCDFILASHPCKDPVSK